MCGFGPASACAALAGPARSGFGGQPTLPMFSKRFTSQFAQGIMVSSFLQSGATLVARLGIDYPWALCVAYANGLKQAFRDNHPFPEEIAPPSLKGLLTSQLSGCSEARSGHH